MEEGEELKHSADTSENDEPIIHHHHNRVPEHDGNSMNHTATASSSILPQTVSHEEGDEIMIGLTLSPSPTMDVSTDNSSSGAAVASLPPIPYTKDATTTTTAADLSLSSIQQEEVDASLLPKPRVANHNTMQQRQQENNVINNNSENNNTSTIQMDDRIKQLESSIGTLTELCQSLLLQNQQLNNRMIGHSRDGSEVRRHY